MFLLVIGTDTDVMLPIWIDKLNGTLYLNLVKNKIPMWADGTYSCRNYIFMQDGAPCHTSKVLHQFSEKELGGKGFWRKGVWHKGFWRKGFWRKGFWRKGFWCKKLWS